MAAAYKSFLAKIRNRVDRALFAGVSAPAQDVAALYRTVDGLKQGFEHLTRARGDPEKSAVLVGELGIFADILLTELGQNGTLRLSENYPIPKNPNSPGEAGTVLISETHLYLCVRTNRWVIVSLAEW